MGVVSIIGLKIHLVSSLEHHMEIVDLFSRSPHIYHGSLSNYLKANMYTIYPTRGRLNWGYWDQTHYHGYYHGMRMEYALSCFMRSYLEHLTNQPSSYLFTFCLLNFPFLLRRPSEQLLSTDVFLGSEEHVAKWIFDPWNCRAWKCNSSCKWVYNEICLHMCIYIYI